MTSFSLKHVDIFTYTADSVRVCTCVHACMRVHVDSTEECVRVDAQSSTGWTARLAARPWARYRPRGLLSDQSAHHHHTGKKTSTLHGTILVDAEYYHTLYIYFFVGTEVDAGGKCPCCTDDWRDPTRSNHSDGIVWDGEASQQVCPLDSLRWEIIDRQILTSVLYTIGFERLWWNLEKSIVGCQALTIISTCTIFWPLLATASSSSKKIWVSEKSNQNLNEPDFWK